ncbi:hypothetical protein [Actinoplanes sp. GCM10030250]|uniref:hypothetical protein n=1 Tax=Actinoplanes sp. GCM10030250 TaxID=3273376 RepID=UPI003609F658
MPALVLSLVAVLLSWRAYSVATDAADKADSLRAAPVATATATAVPPGPAPEPALSTATDPTGAPDPTTTDPEAIPTLGPQTQYAVRYTGTDLKIPASCGNYVNLDLDKPQVQVDAQVAELRFYDSCNATPYFELESGIKGSGGHKETLKVEECGPSIDRGPLANDGRQPVKTGDVYCVRTSRGKAQTAGDTWKMAIVTVTGVAQDRTISLRVSAWDIPD